MHLHSKSKLTQFYTFRSIKKFLKRKLSSKLCLDHKSAVAFSIQSNKHLVFILFICCQISSSAKNNLNLSCKRKSELKPSNGLNPVQGKISKAENPARSKNAAADKLLSKYKSTSDSSCKPLTEGRSKITIPRPFSFATEKRAAASSNLKDDTPRLISNASNRTAPSLIHEKGITIVPVSFPLILFTL